MQIVSPNLNLQSAWYDKQSSFLSTPVFEAQVVAFETQASNLVHLSAPEFAVNVKHLSVVPWYAGHKEVFSIHPVPLVTQSGKNVLQSPSLVLVVSSPHVLFLHFPPTPWKHGLA